MVLDNSYIHINEAIKKYNRSRQTFYNYINKWEVATQKTHNKVYLSVRDLERVLWSYIWENPPFTNNVDEKEEKIWWNILIGKNYREQIDSLSNTVKQLSSKIQSISITQSQNTLPDHTSNAVSESMSVFQDQYSIELSRITAQMKNIHDYCDYIKKIATSHAKKINFTVWYFWIVILNLLILWMIS